MRETGATTFYMPSADYIWPQTLNKKVREVVTAQGGEIVGEEYFPLDHVNYESVVADIMATGADVVFNTIVPPGLTHFLAQLHDAGFTARGGQVVCTYFDENFLNLVPAEHVEGLYGCLDYYRACRIRSASSSSTDTRPGTRAARCSRLARRAPAPTGH
jgi:branched-chain amino acid transport system substrate-binding protein